MYIIYKSSDYIRINIHILSYIPFFQNLVLTFLITTYLLDEHKKKKLLITSGFFFVWSWRESNPRPNEEIISFLHAYLCLIFRVTAEPKPSTITLSS